MDFTMISSIGAYTRTMQMQAQWMKKAESGHYTQKLDSGDEEQMSAADAIKEQLDQLRENNDTNLAAIYTKLQSGKKLTADEMAYLREKNPEAYKKAKELEAERAKFEKELKECRTKEDFQRLKAMHISASLSKVNAIANNPVIPKGKKMELLLEENAKMNALADSAAKFVQSGGYDKLPSEAERNEEIREQEESRKPEELKPEDVKPEQELKPEESKPGQEGIPEHMEKPEAEDSLPAPNTETAIQGQEVKPKTSEQPKRQETSGTFFRGVYAKSAYKETMSLAGDESRLTDGKKTMLKKA